MQIPSRFPQVLQGKLTPLPALSPPDFCSSASIKLDAIEFEYLTDSHGECGGGTEQHRRAGAAAGSHEVYKHIMDVKPFAVRGYDSALLAQCAEGISTALSIQVCAAEKASCQLRDLQINRDHKWMHPAQGPKCLERMPLKAKASFSDFFLNFWQSLRIP